MAKAPLAVKPRSFVVPAAITQNCAGIVIKRADVLPRYVYYERVPWGGCPGAGHRDSHRF